MRISRRGLIGLLMYAPALAAAAPCCGPITPKGARLAALLDGTGVDRLWLAGDKVDWETGVSRGAWNDGKPHTHCSAFVASVAKRLGIADVATAAELIHVVLRSDVRFQRIRRPMRAEGPIGETEVSPDDRQRLDAIFNAGPDLSRYVRRDLATCEIGRGDRPQHRDCRR